MPDFRILIEATDVGPGDIDDLAEDIKQDYGDNFGIADGEFKVTVQQKVGDNYFGRERGDDVING